MPAHNTQYISPDTMDTIEARYRAGDGVTRLGKEYHVSPPRLKGLLMERGISIRANDHPEETRAEVRRLHRDSNLFCHEIQKRFNVSEFAYGNWTRGIRRLNAPKQANPMTGRHFYDLWIERYGQAEADRRMNAFRAQCSRRCRGAGNPMHGRATPNGAGNGWKGWYGEAYFRSLRELTFMLESDRDGVEWRSAEGVSIPYTVDGASRTYRPDFIHGTTLIELKPARLIKTPAVMAKTAAAEAYCRTNGLTYRIYDCGIDLDLIQHAYEAGLVRFVGDYETRFNAFLTGQSPASGISERDAA